jgi:hypothetical protein
MPTPSLLQPAAAGGFRTLSFPPSGVRLRVPQSWTVVAEQPPVVTVVTSGAAVVSVWRYPRTEPLPSVPRALARARAQLISAARARDASLQAGEPVPRGRPRRVLAA